VFAGDELTVVKRAAARDFEEFLRAKDDDLVAARALHRRRDAPGAAFDDVDGAFKIIAFATFAEDPANGAGNRCR
jgi:hypothetical protein